MKNENCTNGKHFSSILSSSNIVVATHADDMAYKVLWAVSFPLCIAGPNIVGSYIYKHTFIDHIPIRDFSVIK